MSNTEALRNGTAKARQLIRTGIMSRLETLMHSTVSDLERRMQSEVSGMTGNTRTSPAAATYADGVIEAIDLGQRNDPLQGKLTGGEKFLAGRQRYDGDIQQKTFTANVATTTNPSPDDDYAILEGQQGGKGYKLVVVGGTEYLGHEQLADSYVYCQQEAQQIFK